MSRRSGTIAFGPGHPATRWASGAGWPMASRRGLVAFDMASRARELYSRIRDAQGSA